MIHLTASVYALDASGVAQPKLDELIPFPIRRCKKYFGWNQSLKLLNAASTTSPTDLQFNGLPVQFGWHDKQASAGAAGFPDRPNQAFLLRIHVVVKVPALVFHHQA